MKKLFFKIAIILLTLLSYQSFAKVTTAKVVHVVVALCDNYYQGIVPVPKKIGGNAHLITFIGHDGLMDFTLDSYPEKSDQLTRELGCIFLFSDFNNLQTIKTNPLL